MPTLAMSAGKVTAIWGQAFVKLPNGKLQLLKVGDKLRGGEQVLTSEDGMVEISPAKPNAKTVLVKAQPDQDADSAIAGLNRDDLDVVPAAGGASGGLRTGLRVDRVEERTNQQEFEFGEARRFTSGDVFNGATKLTPSSAPETPSVVSLGQSSTVNEAVGTVTYTVTLDKPSSTPVTVSFSTQDGSAQAGQDYVAQTGTVTFAPGQTEAKIVVVITNDAVFEGPEAFTVKLGSATGAVLGGGTEVTTTVRDDGTGTPPVGLPADDDRPSLSISGPADVNEAAGTVTYTVTLTGNSLLPVTVDFTTQDGKAVGGADFESATGTLTFAPGETTKQVVVNLLPDTTYEGDEAFVLKLSNPSNAVVTTGSAEVVIKDDGTGTVPTDVDPKDDRPMVVILGDSAVEGSPVGFSVQLTNPSTTAVKVSLALFSGENLAETPENESATLGVDTGTQLEIETAPGVWQALVGNEVTFQPGMTEINVRLATNDDQLFEPEEYIKLQATVVEGVTGNTRQANQVAIADNDAEPKVTDVVVGQSGSGGAVTEGQPLVYGVQLSNPSSTPTVLAFKVGGDTATAGADDFGAPVFSDGVKLNDDGTITVPPGVSSFTVSIPTTPDTVKESNETLPVTVGDVTATGTIVDDDATPTIQTLEPGQAGPGDDNVTEGGQLSYSVTLSNASDKPTTFSFSLGGGSASADDFGAPVFSDGVKLNPDGTITVPAGVTSFTVTVPTTPDITQEATETVLLTIGGVKATGNIIDDDGKPVVVSVDPTASDVKVQEGADLVYKIALSNPSDTPTTYAFKLGGGTAAAEDFGAPTFSDGVKLNLDGTITVPAGVTNFTVTVPTSPDAADEANETVPLSIGGVTSTGTIIDDDNAPTIKTVEPGQPGSGDDSAVEGSPLVYNVALSNPSDQPTTFAFKLGGGTAGSDDIGTPVFSDGVKLNLDGTITVPAGVTSFTVTVPTSPDTTDEANETVPLEIGGTKATGTIVDDDNTPTIKTVEPGQPGSGGDSVTEGQPLVYNVALSNPSDQPTTFSFKLGGGTAGDDDIGTPVFSDGVKLNPDGTITVPAGVTGFSVTVPTSPDTTDESNETVPIEIGGTKATGTIVDDDGKPTIQAIDPQAADARAPEGTALSYKVTLSNASDSSTTYAFKLGDGTAAPEDIGAPTFSDGVKLNADGTITVPEGVTSFTVTVPTSPDLVDESDETVLLSIGGATATGTIVDDDATPTIKTVEPGQPGSGDDSAVEGSPLVYNVALSNPSDQPTTFAFKLGGGTAGSDDIGTPVFSDGVKLNLDGTITVPAGVTSFTVTVPTSPDTTDEANETVPLEIGGTKATGTIVDDDNTPTIKTVEPGQPGSGGDSVTEGQPLVYNVALSNPSDQPTTFSFKLGGGTAGDDDIGTPVFSDGVKLNPDGTITVPAGVTGFSVTVPTSPDTTDESNETVPIEIGGTKATGTIVDDDGKPTIQAIDPQAADARAPEGTALSYKVTLSNASDSSTTYAFKLGDGTAAPEDIGAPTFSDGVKLNADGTITVPEGVTSFTVTVPTSPDLVDESDETVLLSIGGATATGTIVDDDATPTIKTVEPGQPGSGDDSAVEGSPLVYNVALSNPSDQPTTFAFKLGGGTAGSDDIGTPVFSDGVKLNLDGTITVPAGVTSFTVTVPTSPDTTDEANETVPLEIGGTKATGTIVDDDNTPTIKTVEPGQPGSGGDSVTEGQPLVYNVALSNPSDQPTTFSFKLGGGTAGDDDIGTPVFSDGVKLNPDGTITVPAGVTGFSVTVPTSPDTTDESNETVPIEIGGTKATGTIVDDDNTPTVKTIEPGEPGAADDRVTEGRDLSFKVTLSNAADTPTTFAFKLGGGSAAPEDIGAPTFSDGVKLNADGTITVPEGVTSFTVTVPTSPDLVDESDETVLLSIGGATATGTIVDDDATPTIKTVEPGQPGSGDDSAVEGSPLVYNVALSNPSDQPTTFAFKLGGGTAGSDDIGTPVFSDGVKLNLDGTITVPAGVTSFTVTVPTSPDTTDEANETVPLEIGGTKATGTIVDDDNTPTIKTVEPGQPGSGGDSVTEGQPLVYNVALSNPSDQPTTFSFKLGGGTAGDDDIGTPVFSDGVKLNPDGTITVPAGVTGFSVTVPTSPDTTDESNETVPIEIGGTKATGTIVDDDGTPAIKTIDPTALDVQVPEGTSLGYKVTLSNESDTPTVYAFKLGGGTAGSGDFGAPTFSDGVKLNDDGTITVPARVSSFTVTVPTTQDPIDEADETVPLTIGGVTATGTIIDDDNTPTIQTVEPGQAGPAGDTATEGAPLVYNVTLSNPSAEPISFTFKLGGGTAANDDIGTPVFSDGVKLNADGTITVPAGVTSFSVTVPTTPDTVAESNETVVVEIGGVKATGTIIDDDGKPTVKTVEPGQPGAGDDSVTEGSPLTYNVTLSNAADTPTTLAFKVGGGTAANDDIGTPVFSDGVKLNADGTITVPAGVTSFSVTVPTTPDTVAESNETVVVEIGGVKATGTIIDDDGKPTVKTVEPGQPGAGDDSVTEGSPLTYNVTLSNAADTPTTLAFKVGGGTAANDDIGTPVFSDGVKLNADGTITVPAGVTSFSVTVPTTPDTVAESNETVVVEIGGVKATGTIIDDDGKPTVKTVEPGQPGAGDDSVTEGSPLTYNVTLSNAADTPTTLAFKVGGGTAANDDIGTPVFSDGVKLNADGTITVPAGVTSFSVTVPTTPDTVAESNETVVVEIGGVKATGTIIDDDGKPTVKTVEPGQPGAGDDNVTEGSPLTYNVTLSNAADTPTTLAFKVGGGTAANDDIGTPVFSDGVKLNADGTITVPAGVTSFSVTVPTTPDTVAESNETVVVEIGGVKATGTIIDDDGKPTVKTVEPGQPGLGDDSVTEGSPLTYNVTLSNAADTPTTLAFKVGGGTAANDDIGTPVFSDGVKLNADGTITVPAGVTSFSVTIPTTQDPVKEANETVRVMVGTVTANGTIIDDDLTPTVKTIEPGQAGAGDDAVTEGNVVSFNVTLSNPSDAPTTLSFKLGGDTAGTGDYGTPSFSDGVKLNPDGTITVPAGVTSFTVTVPTTQDKLTEATEKLPLNIGGVVANASILDDDAVPVVDLDGDDSAGVAAGGYKTTYTEKSATPTRIADADIRITDADSTTLQGATVTLTNLKSGDVLSFLDTLPTSVRGDINGNKVTFTGAASLAEYQAAIRAVGFANTSGNPDTTARNFDVVVNDGSNDSAVVRTTVSVVAVNDAPLVTAVTNNVAEEGLAGGLAGASGPANAPGANACQGKVVFSDVDSTTLTVSLAAPTTDVFASNGIKVTWVSDGKGGLIGSAGTTIVATATMNGATGDYTFTLNAPLKHSVAGEDTLNIRFGLNVSDGNKTTESSLTISVKDDAPVTPAPIQQSLQTLDTNLLIVLDNSGSMADPSGIGTLTRLAAAVQSIKNLLDGYEDLGGVTVRLVTFSSATKDLGGKWLTVAEAKAELDAVKPDFNTNYDIALSAAQTAFNTTGKLSGAQNVAYFFSDGIPNEGTNGAGINATEEGNWQNFLNANQINCFAVGLGTNVNQAALNPIAYDGQASDNTSAVVVSSLTQLDAALADTYVGSIKGNLTASGTARAPMGADGFARVDSVLIDGILHTYAESSAQGILTVRTVKGGDFTFNMNSGEYSYNAPGQLPTATVSQEEVKFTLADADGDTATSTLTLNLERTLVQNGTAAGDTYTTSLQSSIIMGRDGNDVLTAGTGGSRLYGNNGADVLNGGKGDDLLHGGAGNDTITGGDGADTVTGGAGSDILTGGLGADVFAWHLADPGTVSARADDRIKDFSISQGDVLDLRDLLQNETTVATTLDNYLSFDTTTTAGTTIIKVSPTGGGFGSGLFNPTTETERIILEGVNLRAELGLPSNASDALIITQLLNKKTLVVDNG